MKKRPGPFTLQHVFSGNLQYNTYYFHLAVNQH